MPPTLSRDAQQLRISWPHLTLQVLLRGDRLLGVGDLWHDEFPLRQASVPWRPLLSTTDGVQYPELPLREVRVTGDAVALVCDAIGTRTRLAETQDEYLREVVDLTPEAPIVDQFIWHFSAATARLGGHDGHGFSYHYEWRSSDPRRQCHRLFDLASWALGGGISDNTLLFQAQLNPPAHPLSRAGYFTTACNYYGAEMKGRLGPGDRISIQRVPRLATLQAFDLLEHPRGLLWNTFTPGADVVSLLQKEEGEDCLHILDEYRFAKASHFATSPRRVIFLPLPATRPAVLSRNLWYLARQEVHAAERARLGIKPSPVLPRVWLPQVPTEQYQLLGQTGPRERLLHHLADEILPRWADMGVREVCAPSLWRSDYSELRFARKQDSGMQGELVVSGICCVHEHRISPIYGGVAGLAYFVERAHRLGIQVQLWWATHLSRRAPIFAQHPEWMIQSRDGQFGCGGIGKHVCIPMDLNNPDCFAWELGLVKELLAATGVDGFFHDSYGNYTFLPTNHADPRCRSQQEAYGRLVRAMQDAGVKTLTAEGLGPWATGHFGMRLLPTEPGQARRYQNALDWWLTAPDMVAGLNMGIGAALWAGREAEAREFAFRCLAAGGRFGFTQVQGGIELWEGWLREHNQLHARLGPIHGDRELLPDDAGVHWWRPAGDELRFCFRAGTLTPGPGQAVWRMTAQCAEALPPGAALATAAGEVYRLAPSGSAHA